MSDYKQFTLEERIDLMGDLKAQMADLEAKYEELKALVIEDAGLGAHEGSMFRASITSQERETLDMEAVRNHLSPQFIRAHTKTTKSIVTRVTARTGKK